MSLPKMQTLELWWGLGLPMCLPRISTAWDWLPREKKLKLYCTLASNQQSCWSSKCTVCSIPAQVVDPSEKFKYSTILQAWFLEKAPFIRLYWTNLNIVWQGMVYSEARKALKPGHLCCHCSFSRPHTVYRLQGLRVCSKMSGSLVWRSQMQVVWTAN